MARPVVRWMLSMDLQVKSEFITPWGMCDLVGLNFKKRSVTARLKLGQKQPVGSLTGSALLAQIPDAATGRSISLKRLTEECVPTISEEIVLEQTRRLVASGFVRMRGDRMQKLNGWMPLHKQLIAVELKLNRVEEAISQARNNLIFADSSYVGLPKELALRVASRRIRESSFLESGVGLLAVASGECEILIPSRHSAKPDPVIQFYCVEKFWRTYPKGS